MPWKAFLVVMYGVLAHFGNLARALESIAICGVPAHFGGLGRALESVFCRYIRCSVSLWSLQTCPGKFRFVYILRCGSLW